MPSPSTSPAVPSVASPAWLNAKLEVSEAQGRSGDDLERREVAEAVSILVAREAAQPLFRCEARLGRQPTGAREVERAAHQQIGAAGGSEALPEEPSRG